MVAVVVVVSRSKRSKRSKEGRWRRSNRPNASLFLLVLLLSFFGTVRSFETAQSLFLSPARARQEENRSGKEEGSSLSRKALFLSMVLKTKTKISFFFK